MVPLVSDRSLSGSQLTWPSYTAEALLELIWIAFGNCGINASSWARRGTASSWGRLACFLLGAGIPAWVPLALIPGRRFSSWKGGWGPVCAKGPGSFLRERALTATVLRARARARGERHHSELSSSSLSPETRIKELRKTAGAWRVKGRQGCLLANRVSAASKSWGVGSRWHRMKWPE